MLAAGSVHAMGSPQSTNPNGPNYVPPAAAPQTAPATSPTATPDANASAGSMSSWLQKTITGPNGISTVPEDIWGTTGLSNSVIMPKLAPFIESFGFLLLSFGFVFNMYKNHEKYVLGLEGQAQPYFKLFYSFIFSAVFIFMWAYNQGGSGNIFYEYLAVVNNMYIYITGNIMGAAAYVGLLHNIHHTTTVVVNEVHNTKTGGWSWNPLSWASAAIGAIFGYIIKTSFELITTFALMLLYFLYLILSYLVYVVQLLFLGTLYAVFPIVIAVNYGEYAKDMKILANWVKWFIEVSLWGVFISLEFTIFAYIVGNHFADSNSIISPLTAVLLLILMCFLPLAGPVLLHKIFGLHGAHEHSGNLKQKTKPETKDKDSGNAQIAKGLAKLGHGDISGGKDIMNGMKANAAKAKGETGSEQSPASGPVAGGVAPGVSDYKPKEKPKE